MVDDFGWYGLMLLPIEFLHSEYLLLYIAPFTATLQPLFGVNNESQNNVAGLTIVKTELN